MYDILRTYLRKHRSKYFDFYFYCYDSNIKEDFEIKDDIIYIKGRESFVPGILQKTISAFQFSLNFEYDYLVRTNISTIVNWNKFRNKLDSLTDLDPIKNIVYGGSISVLGWLDNEGGIFDEKYKHQKFASGISIILSRRAIELISYSKDIDMSIIDDVAIGVFFYPKHVQHLLDLVNFIKYNNEYGEDTIIYRNRSENRNIDIVRMKNICENIIYKMNIHNIAISSEILRANGK